jgi:hypothetical protein
MFRGPERLYCGMGRSFFSTIVACRKKASREGDTAETEALEALSLAFPGRAWEPKKTPPHLYNVYRLGKVMKGF